MRACFLLIAGTAMAAPAVQWGTVPLSFEPNTGQAPAEVRYLVRGSAYTLYLACGEAVLAGREPVALADQVIRRKPFGSHCGRNPAGLQE